MREEIKSFGCDETFRYVRKRFLYVRRCRMSMTLCGKTYTPRVSVERNLLCVCVAMPGYAMISDSLCIVFRTPQTSFGTKKVSYGNEEYLETLGKDADSSVSLKSRTRTAAFRIAVESGTHRRT